MSAPETGHGTWLATGPAAARLGITPDGLRKQIRRGKCPYSSRRDNAGQWHVLVPDTLGTVSSDSREMVPDTRDELLAELRQRVATLERRLDDAAGERAELLALLADLMAQLAREREADFSTIGKKPRPGVVERVRRWLWGERGEGQP